MMELGLNDVVVNEFSVYETKQHSLHLFFPPVGLFKWEILRIACQK